MHSWQPTIRAQCSLQKTKSRFGLCLSMYEKSAAREEKGLLGDDLGDALTGRVHKHDAVAGPEPAGAEQVRRYRPCRVVGSVASDHVSHAALRVQIAVHRPVRVRLHIPPQRIHNPIPALRLPPRGRRHLCAGQRHVISNASKYYCSLCRCKRWHETLS